MNSLTQPWKTRCVKFALACVAGVVALAGTPAPAFADAPDLDSSAGKKNLAMVLVSTNENSSVDWEEQYDYIEDIGDGRGYTGGLVGFTSGTGDMLTLVENYTNDFPDNPLAAFLPALRDVNGSGSTEGLDVAFENAWREAAQLAGFRQAQRALRDSMYFTPAVEAAKADGLGALGQFIYFDAYVMHGPGNDWESFGGIRAAAHADAATPANGGDEAAYLHVFLDARAAVMKSEQAHADTSRIDKEQRIFVDNGNFDLTVPITWSVYGSDTYRCSDYWTCWAL